jgi:hypothetical protein
MEQAAVAKADISTRIALSEREISIRSALNSIAPIDLL